MTCVVGDLEEKVQVTWEDYNNITITDGTKGYIFNHSTFSIDNDTAESVQTSTLTIIAAKLETIVRNEGVVTNWACKVQSIRFPRSKMERRSIRLEYLIIGK